MIKVFICLLVFSLGVSASVHWEKSMETTERSFNDAGFLMLQKKYPAEFSSLKPELIGTAEYTMYVYEYKGKTVCPQNDPRLFFRISSYGYCERPSQNGMCMVTSVPQPPEADPCSY